MRYLLLACCCLSLVFGGTETKSKADDYEVHGQSGNLAIGADFDVHSYGRGEQMFIAKDYLVVEVALFPPKGTEFELHNGDFSLRINGKTGLLASDPNMVTADMRHPEFQSGPWAQAGGGMDGHDVMIGGPPQDHPFPGATVPTTTQPQPRPPLEIPKDNPSGVKAQPVDPYQMLLETALDDGQHHAPISGFLYFHFRGNLKSVKTLELVYRDAVLKLR